MFDQTIDFIRSRFGTDEFIPLHEPCFAGHEREYVLDCIDSTFVSSVGQYVDRFEKELAAYTGAKYAVAVVNGTSALHAALVLSGVSAGDEVITQPLTFIATANAISYCGGTPIFVDVDRATLGMSPDALRAYLEEHAVLEGGTCRNRSTGRTIRAVVPMHTFGHPARILDIVEVCDEFGLTVIEDAAESLGSLHHGRHSGTFGKMGVFSFNGNKTITCGGGGALITDDGSLARKAKHLTTTAKTPHKWAYIHDEVGFNYRMPNLNAALACAQLELLDSLIEDKRQLASEYQAFFERLGFSFVTEPQGARSNYWLNALILDDLVQRNQFLEETNAQGVMTRPVWQLMHRLEMYKHSPTGNLEVSEWLEQRVVNIPSSARL